MDAIRSKLKNISNREVLYLLITWTVVLSVLSVLTNEGQFTLQWLSDWSQNFSTEMLGAIMTFLLFEKIISEREKKKEHEQQKKTKIKNLISELRSDDKATAKSAHQKIADNGWWLDGSLIAADLSGADLHGCSLHRANLLGANLQGANLSGATLGSSDLVGADLSDAKLVDAILNDCDMGKANLDGADLQRASMETCKLYNANLSDANLAGAKLGNYFPSDDYVNYEDDIDTTAKFDTATILPDGDRWSEDTDMKRFTNPNHPDFWLSE
jgi:hypothetical protein